MCFLYSIVNNIWVNKIYKAPHWVFIYIFILHVLHLLYPRGSLNLWLKIQKFLICSRW